MVLETKQNLLLKVEIVLEVFCGKGEYQSTCRGSPHVEAVRREFCKVFAKPMGLGELDELFPFEYLQRTGAGSRSLCRPAVSESFE